FSFQMQFDPATLAGSVRARARLLPPASPGSRTRPSTLVGVFRPVDWFAFSQSSTDHAPYQMPTSSLSHASLSKGEASKVMRIRQYRCGASFSVGPLSPSSLRRRRSSRGANSLHTRASTNGSIYHFALGTPKHMSPLNRNRQKQLL